MSVLPELIISKPNQALALPRTVGVTTLFPQGQPLDDLWVIPHGVEEYHTLRKLGYELPSPMCYYEWNKNTPFDVQRKTCDLLVGNHRAYVLNDMGTGKTRTVLWAWDCLRSVGAAGKLLVVAPLSTLELVWGNQAFGTIPHRKVVILHGTRAQRLKALATPEAEIFVINHDGLQVIHNEITARKDIDTLCIDELAVYRNSSSRSKLMQKFVEGMKWVWGLTGTPMPNAPTDVWMQCRIVTPHTVPRYFSHARDALMLKKSEFLWVPKEHAVETAYSWMQPAVRFTLDDVVELPELVERYIDVPMSKEVMETYKNMVNDLITRIKDKKIVAMNAGVAMNKLLQISGGYVYDDNHTTVELDADERKDILIDLIESTSGKVIVFCPFRHMVTGLAKTLKHIDHAIIHGDVDAEDRNKIFQAFQTTPQYKVLLAHPATMHHGITLTAADTIIWFCPILSLEIYEQACARIRRVGQTRKQQVLHLQGTPVERRIYALLRRKASVQDKLLALFEEATS